MSFLGDLFMGRKSSPTLLPGVQDSINALNGLNFGLGKQGKIAKHFLADWSAGRDTSDSGFYAPLRQQEMADLSDIDMDFMSGASGLVGAQGGDDAVRLAALKERAKEQRREQTGKQTVDAMTGLAGWASDTLERANARRDANELAKQQMILGARGMTYDANARTGGLLPSLIQGAAQLGSAYLGGPAALPKFGETGSKSFYNIIGSTPAYGLRGR